MAGAGDIDPSGARILAPIDRVAHAEAVGAAVVDGHGELMWFHDVTVMEPTSDPQPGTRLSAVLDRPELPASVVAGFVTAAYVGADLIVLVPEPATSSRSEAVPTLRARCVDLTAEGVPAHRVVAEVALTPGVVDRITALRVGGLLVGAVVPPTASPADSADPAQQGAVIGSLAAAIVAGVATVRTADAAREGTVRRVRAVVARLTGASVG